MKKFITFIALLFFYSSAHSNNIVYLDVQFIVDNSELGKLYKKKIQDVNNKNNLELKNQEKIINEKEIEIKNKKNILSKTETEKKIKELNKLLKTYQLSRNDFNTKIIEEKKTYTSKILQLLNPLLTNYVDKNEIILVVDKKNILVGIKSLDITNDILNILNDESKKKNLLNEN